MSNYVYYMYMSIKIIFNICVLCQSCSDLHFVHFVENQWLEKHQFEQGQDTEVFLKQHFPNMCDIWSKDTTWVFPMKKTEEENNGYVVFK